MRLIDANALIESIKAQAGMLNWMLPEADEITDVLSNGFIEQINKMPTIQPERKRGEWIDDYDPAKFGEFRYKCSKCGARTVEWADNFCYCCGADMRGEQE